MVVYADRLGLIFFVSGAVSECIIINCEFDILRVGRADIFIGDGYINIRELYLRVTDWRQGKKEQSGLSDRYYHQFKFVGGI